MRRAAVLLVLIACSDEQPAPRATHLAFEGSDAGLELAQAAAREWAAQCSVAIEVSREPGGVPLYEIGKSRGLTIQSRGAPQVVAVVAGSPQATWAHELGHVLGIVHHTPAGLMEATAPDGSRVTSAECGMLPR